VLYRLHEKQKPNRCPRFMTPWSTRGKGTKGHKSFIDVTYQRVCEAHFSIMQQLAAMRPYVKKHLQELHERIQNETLIMK
jgi:hypothetical protein